MARQGKRYRDNAKDVDREKRYPLSEAIVLSLGTSAASSTRR